MDENAEKISGKLHKEKSIKKYSGNINPTTLLICILISTALWFLTVLGKTYSTNLFYPVKYVSMPKDKVLSNEPPSKLELKVTAPGYIIVFYRILMAYSPVYLNLENLTRDIKPTPNGYLIRTETLTRNISSQMSSDITLNSINPDYLTFRFDSLVTRMVEIRPVIETSYRQQFNIAGPVKVMPDKVQVKGIREMIDTINFVLTEKKTFSSLDKTVKGNLRLIIPPRTELEPVRITIEIPVEEFTEKEMMVPVVMINNPGSQEIKLFPSMVRLTFLTSLTQFKLISPENFKVVADFNDIKPGITLLPVRVEKKPDLIQSFKYSPESVEFLIERK